MSLLGDVTRPLKPHSNADMALCRSKSDAAYLSLRACGMDQEHVAERMAMDPGHLSRLIRGNRPWNDAQQERFERITGSLALTQYDCMKRGGVFYVDPLDAREAQLKAELAEIERQKAA